MNSDFINILISSDFFPVIGGAHSWMYEVYKRWPEPVALIAPDYSLSDEDDIIINQKKFDLGNHGSLNINRFPMNIADINVFSFFFWRNIARLASSIGKLADQRPVIFHVLRAFPDGILPFYYKFLYKKDCKVVTYVHGEDLNIAATSRQIFFLARIILFKSTLVIANSKSTLDKIKKFSNKLEAVEVVHPGVETAEYSFTDKEKALQREKWGVSSTCSVLLTMARLERRKNHAMVLNVLSDLINDGFDIKYVIGSDGPEKQSLIEFANHLGVTDSVIFTGLLSKHDKMIAFASADIHIMPSIITGPMEEGFGIVFLEAAAAGIPSIAGNSGGQKEAVLDGVTGLIVDGEDKNQVKEALAKLINNKPLARKMGIAGRSWAKENDWDMVQAKTWKTVCTHLK